MYQRPEKPSFEVEEFSAIYPSSFYPNSTEHLSCNNSQNGLIKGKTYHLAEKLSSQKYSSQMGGGYNKPLGRTILVLESSRDFEPYPKGSKPTPKSHWKEQCS